MEKSYLLGELELILGPGSKRSRDNYAFTCPFPDCTSSRTKKKLEVDLHTDDQGKNHWACWVCQARGSTIKSLLTQLGVSKDKVADILKFVHKGDQAFHTHSPLTVTLPKEYQSLVTASTTSIYANKVKQYLYNRGLTDRDFIKYQIGYCTTGEYSGRIIIPSFDKNNRLNYFTGRSYEKNWMKYKNPELPKTFIPFENLINWNQPIIVCEGVFDAISIKRNVIPILGKTITDFLLKSFLEHNVQKVFVALDPDAKQVALRYSEQLERIGIQVYLVNLPDGKDPSDLGFEKFTRLVAESEKIDTHSWLEYKLSNI